MSWTVLRVWVPVALLATASLIPFWTASVIQHPIDDQYITITYARNLAAGNGFVYNGGSPSLGTTTPLFTLTLAALEWAVPVMPLDRAGLYLSAVCWLLNAWCVVLFRRSLGLGFAGAVAVAISVLSIHEAYVGGEYAMFGLLLLLSAVCFGQRRWLLCGVCTGLLYMTRGEGGLLLPLIALAHGWGWWREKERNWGALLVPLVLIGVGFLLTAGVWSAWAWHTFGSPLPHTLRMKMLQARQDAASLGGYFQGMLWRAMRGEWGVPAFQFFTPLRVILWALAMLGVGMVVRRGGPWALIVGWTALYVGTYTALTLPGYSFWYGLPPLWCWHYLVGLGLAGALGARMGPAGQRAVAAASLLVLGLLLGGRLLSTVQHREDPRGAYYIAFSEWFQRQGVAPEDRLAAYDAGFLGYYSEMPLYDMAGLVRPELQPWIMRRDEAGLLAEVKPRFLVRTYAHAPARGATEIIGGTPYRQRFLIAGPREMRYYEYLAILERERLTSAPSGR